MDEVNKELVIDGHHLARVGVRLSDSNESGIHVPNKAKSSVIVDGKEKQDLDPSLVLLKKFVSKKKIDVLSQEGDGVF